MRKRTTKLITLATRKRHRQSNYFILSPSSLGLGERKVAAKSPSPFLPLPPPPPPPRWPQACYLHWRSPQISLCWPTTSTLNLWSRSPRFFKSGQIYVVDKSGKMCVSKTQLHIGYGFTFDWLFGCTLLDPPQSLLVLNAGLFWTIFSHSPYRSPFTI